MMLKLLFIIAAVAALTVGGCSADRDGGPSQMSDNIQDKMDATEKWAETDGADMVESTTDKLESVGNTTTKAVNKTKSTLETVGEASIVIGTSVSGSIKKLGQGVLDIKSEEEAYKKAHPEKY